MPARIAKDFEFEILDDLSLEKDVGGDGKKPSKTKYRKKHKGDCK